MTPQRASLVDIMLTDLTRNFTRVLLFLAKNNKTRVKLRVKSVNIISTKLARCGVIVFQPQAAPNSGTEDCE